jgi:methyl-accepting chemotaxis protein
MKSRWTLGRKLMAAFLAISAITLVLGGVGYYGATHSGAAIEDLGAVMLPTVDGALSAKEASTAIKAAERTLLAQGLDAETRKRQYQRIADAEQQQETAWKMIEALPKSAAEDQLWEKLKPAWAAWQGENKKFLDICKEFDQRAILDPSSLAQKFELFRTDHHKLLAKLLTALHTKELFDGGEDHTQCNFGKWSGTFKAADPELESALLAAAAPHQRFHELCAKIKQLLSAGDTDSGFAIYSQEMVPAKDEVFAAFQAIDKEIKDAQSTTARAQEQLMGKCLETQQVAIGTLDDFVALARKEAATDVSNSQHLAATTKTLTLAATIAGVICALGLGLLITRGINKTLTQISTQLNEGAAQVNDAAAQVAMAAQQLAEGASEEAASLQETSSALEEMAAVTRTNAESARTANSLADQAHKKAAEGDQTMVQLNAAMTAINQSAGQIGKIIKVIEEIAFQTNLLALNAAVEAARAGEHGKGFAVVAEEVRNLAQRAAGAARETTGLIEGSVTRAKEGTAVADSAGKALQAIVTDVTQVAELLNGITRASDEQAQGVEQINTAVTQMDQVTQQNASVAEESAAAAEELSAQSHAVKEMVDTLLALVGGSGGVSQMIHTAPHAAKPLPRPLSNDKAHQVVAKRPPAHLAAVPARHAAGSDDLSSF